MALIFNKPTWRLLQGIEAVCYHQINLPRLIISNLMVIIYEKQESTYYRWKGISRIKFC